MRKFMTVVLAAAAVGGSALAVAAPASGQDWRTYRGYDYDRGYRDYDYNRGYNRGYDYRRGDSYHPPRYEMRRNGCATYWYWDDSRDRYVRRDRCY